MVAEGTVFRQELVVRSFDVNADSKMSLVALGNYLQPGWNDMDMNQHVNNVKYFEWILEGVPSWITSTHQLSSINLEFRKECGMDATLKSLSKYIGNYNSESDCPTNGNGKGLIEVEHSLRLDNGLEVARGRTLWNLKHLHN
ncbi:hypothetical protein V6N13_015990 [Hibiscus sabdariffa]|uniref:Acyl-ACP thioesterase-like C-terminal domain-containing protein n=1 Tax=Hibiscus sabdariffa TaxID=183260 RepID=A0ABR2CXA5_9ROSI